MTRTAGSKNIPWESIVKTLRSHPERWMLLPEMVGVSIRTVMVVKSRERHALRLEDGRIRYRRRATVWLEDGRVVCDLWLRYQPKETP